MAKPGSLEKKVTLRMDDELWETLKIMAKRDPKLNQSQMVREALQLWINLQINREFNPDSDLCVLSINMLKLALDSMTEAQLIQMSHIAFENSKASYTNFEKVFGEDHLFQDRVKALDSVEGRLTSLVRTVYGPTGYRWFDSISYTVHGDTVVITGSHRLGSQFTRFFKSHLANNLDEIHYEFESLEVSFVERKNDSREDHVVISFSKK